MASHDFIWFASVWFSWVIRWVSLALLLRKQVIYKCLLILAGQLFWGLLVGWLAASWGEPSSAWNLSQAVLGRVEEPREWMEVLRPLEVQAWNRHTITSASFSWPKPVTGQPKFKGLWEIPVLNGRSWVSHCKGHTHRKGQRTGITFTFNPLQSSVNICSSVTREIKQIGHRRGMAEVCQPFPFFNSASGDLSGTSADWGQGEKWGKLSSWQTLDTDLEIGSFSPLTPHPILHILCHAHLPRCGG